jgi:hypothetical protein
MSGWLVITPTLGQSPWLDETVASVAGLPRACRHVLVCPGSVRAELERRFPHAQVVTEPGGGLYAAINAGIAAAPEGDALTYLNDDDVLCAGGTARAWQRLEEDARTDVVYGKVSLIDAAGAGQGWLPVAHRPGDLASLLARGIVPLAQPGTWLRPAMLKRLGGFDASFRLAGDLDFFSRALAGGAQFDFVPAEVARFRLHPAQLSKNERAGDDEKARALTRWADAPRSISALLRFRRDNLPGYLDRVRRLGFVSMRRIYRGS